jgi:hypothetical protein
LIDSAVLAQQHEGFLGHRAVETKTLRDELDGVFFILTKIFHRTEKAAQEFPTCCEFFSSFSTLAEKPVSGALR